MELVHDRRGAGEPLVLLHGIGSRWQAFAPVAGRLAAEFEVWSVDLPGFGASPALPGRTDIPALTTAIAGWMAEQGLERPHVAGNSMGGGVALELAARDAVGSACALAPVGFWSARERAFAQTSLRSTRALSQLTRPLSATIARNPALRRIAFRQYLAKPGNLSVDDFVGSVDALVGAPAFADANASFSGYLAPEAAADHVPVTIVWGAKDLLLLPRQLERARRRLPRARHVLLPTAGHVMMYDEPEAVAAAIRTAARDAR